MSGCFGNDPEDRAREKELNEYLDRTYGDDDTDKDDEPDDLDFIEAVREKERDDKMEAEYE